MTEISTSLLSLFDSIGLIIAYSAVMNSRSSIERRGTICTAILSLGFDSTELFSGGRGTFIFGWIIYVSPLLIFVCYSRYDSSALGC